MAKIAIIGTGYIGLVTGTLFADRGNDVICVDKNPQIVDMLNSGKIHIYEPGLEELVFKNTKAQRLKFTMDIKDAVETSDIIFIGVNTPSNESGEFNLDYFLKAAKDVGTALKTAKGYKVVVGKSTVPQGTFRKAINVINEEISNNIELEWDYVSNPETLAEGTAVRDFSFPDRIIIGTESERAFQIMEDIYHPFNITKNKIMRGSPSDAELAKLFSNTALAARVSMVNEFARIADVTEGADMDNIRRMVCEDNRIGYSFMFPSTGYGGSCFPKDIQGVVFQSKKDGYQTMLLDTIHQSNEMHKEYLGKKITDYFNDDINGKKIAVWGLTFKPNTDDMRDAASIKIINYLLGLGAKIVAYDPKDEKAREVFGDKIEYSQDKFEMLENADALVLLTEWREFDSVDFDSIAELMAGDVVFDFRNRWLATSVNKSKLNYIGVGRKYIL